MELAKYCCAKITTTAKRHMTGKRRKTEANHMAGKFKTKTCWSTIDYCNLGIPWYTWVRLPSSPRRARWCRMHVFFCFALFALLCVRVGSLCVSFPLLPSFFSLCTARLLCVFSRCCEMLFVFLSFSSCLLWLAALVPSIAPLLDSAPLRGPVCVPCDDQTGTNKSNINSSWSYVQGVAANHLGPLPTKAPVWSGDTNLDATLRTCNFCHGKKLTNPSANMCSACTLFTHYILR